MFNAIPAFGFLVMIATPCVVAFRATNRDDDGERVVALNQHAAARLDGVVADRASSVRADESANTGERDSTWARRARLDQAEARLSKARVLAAQARLEAMTAAAEVAMLHAVAAAEAVLDEELVDDAIHMTPHERMRSALERTPRGETVRAPQHPGEDLPDDHPAMDFPRARVRRYAA
jgi:hypothetical protein